jgi:polyhydroxybutyrate depolymerase
MRITKLFLVLIVCFVGFYSIAQAEELTFKVGGLERDLIVNYPENSANIPVPLVMIFHGGGGNSSWMQRHSTELNGLLLNAGYAVAFMNGTGMIRLNSWNAKHCCAYAAKNKIDDIAYIDAAINAISKKYLIDERNIFFVGHSNGGMISYRAVGEISRAIKGVIAVSSAIFDDQAVPKYPFSLLMIQTKDDEIIPFTGGMSKNRSALRTQKRPYMGFEDSVDLWKKYLRCGQENQKTVSDDILMRSADCEAGNFIRIFELTKGGHKWNKEVAGVSLPQEILLFIQDAVRTVSN